MDAAQRSAAGAVQVRSHRMTRRAHPGRDLPGRGVCRLGYEDSDMKDGGGGLNRGAKGRRDRIVGFGG